MVSFDGCIWFVLDSLELSANSIFQFHFSLHDVDRDIVTYVLQEPHEKMSKLHKELGNLALLKIVSDPDSAEYSVEVKPSLTPVSKLTLHYVSIFYSMLYNYVKTNMLITYQQDYTKFLVFYRDQ